MGIGWSLTEEEKLLMLEGAKIHCIRTRFGYFRNKNKPTRDDWYKKLCSLNTKERNTIKKELITYKQTCQEIKQKLDEHKFLFPYKQDILRSLPRHLYIKKVRDELDKIEKKIKQYQQQQNQIAAIATRKIPTHLNITERLIFHQTTLSTDLQERRKWIETTETDLDNFERFKRKHQKFESYLNDKKTLNKFIDYEHFDARNNNFETIQKLESELLNKAITKFQSFYKFLQLSANKSYQHCLRLLRVHHSNCLPENSDSFAEFIDYKSVFPYWFSDQKDYKNNFNKIKTACQINFYPAEFFQHLLQTSRASEGAFLENICELVTIQQIFQNWFENQRKVQTERPPSYNPEKTV